MTITRLNVTGVKGDAESTYRSGDVNLTPANIGAAAASHSHSYLPLSGGTETGQVIFTTHGSPIRLKAPNINRDAANPSSTQYENHIWFQDKDGENLGLIRSWRNTSGVTGLQFGVCNENASNNGDSWLWLSMQKPAAGGAGTWSVGEAGNFRSAIGADNAANLTTGTLSNARVAYASKDYTSAKTYGAIQFRKWGRMCTCDVNSFKSLASGSNTIISSLDAAYRPVVDVSMTRTDPGDGKRYRVTISAAGVVAIYAYSTPASTVNIDDTFTYATAS